MELLSDHVILQRLRRYLAVGLMLLVFSLASISLAFAFRQQRSRLTAGQGMERSSETGVTQILGESLWQLPQGGLEFIEGNVVHLDAGALMITSQPGGEISFESTYWMARSETTGAHTPDILFRYQSRDSTYRLRWMEGRFLILEKISEGEALRAAWVELPEEFELPVTVAIETKGQHILVWLQGELYIDYLDPEPLPGEGLGILAGAEPVIWRVDRLGEWTP